MSRKDRITDRVMISRRLPIELWERFRLYCEYHVPRVSDTEMIEVAMEEFLEKREKEKARKSK